MVRDWACKLRIADGQRRKKMLNHKFHKLQVVKRYRFKWSGHLNFYYLISELRFKQQSRIVWWFGTKIIFYITFYHDAIPCVISSLKSTYTISITLCNDIATNYLTYDLTVKTNIIREKGMQSWRAYILRNRWPLKAPVYHVIIRTSSRIEGQKGNAAARILWSGGN
jgi:hypothetical protein